MTILDLPYRPKPLTFILGSLFCGVLAAFMAHEALGNRRGLIIEGMIKLSPHGATIFYWGLCGLFLAVLALVLPAFVLSLKREQRVVLTDTSLSAPKSALSKAPTVIPLADIRQLWVQKVSRQKLLNIHHHGGRLSIPMSFLPDEQAFNKLCGELERRVDSQARAPFG